jgi:copper(I)-binding protein
MAAQEHSMLSRIFRVAALCIGFLLVLLTPPGVVLADDAKDLQVSDAWLRATPPGASVAAGYLTLHNAGHQDFKLVGVLTKLAQSAHVHESFQHNGEEEMRPVHDGLPIKAGQTVHLAPSGYHIMLMGLDHPLTVGSIGALTLVLDDGSKVEVTAPVRDEAPAGTPQ